MYKKLFSFILFLFHSLVSMCQIEVSYLKREKGKGAFGWGTYLHLGVPISQKSSITIDAGFTIPSKDENGDGYVIAPVSLGYRYYLDETGGSFFIEPQAGYCWGGTDFVRKDKSGNDVLEYDGYAWKPVYEESKGFLAGINFGYHFAGTVPIDLGIRYQRVFVSVDPSINVLSLRASAAIRNKRRE